MDIKLTIYIVVILLSSIDVPRALANEINGGSCEIRHPSPQSELDRRHEYPLALLAHFLALTEEEFGPCELVEMGALSQKREIAWLKDNELDVSWLPAITALNESLLYVPVPIRKGLLGWRVLLIHKDNVDAFKNVNSLADLQAFNAGFGAAWGDLPVMQHNLETVTTSAGYESLFEMLDYKRFDFLSRSFSEAFDEVYARAEQQPNIVIEPRIALRYPEAHFFYFSNQSGHIKKRIEEGFKKSIQEGSFNIIFYGYYGEYIDKVRMFDRLILDLDNPFIPSNVPLDDPELWFKLDVYEEYLRQNKR